MNFLHNMPAVATATIMPSVFLISDPAVSFGVKTATAPMSKMVGVSQAGPKTIPGLLEELGAGAVSEPAAEAGDGVGIYTLGDVCLLTVGSAACTNGALLKNDLNGHGIPATTGQYFGARAWQAGQPGDKIQVEVLFGMV